MYQAGCQGRTLKPRLLPQSKAVKSVGRGWRTDPGCDHMRVLEWSTTACLRRPNSVRRSASAAPPVREALRGLKVDRIGLSDGVSDGSSPRACQRLTSSRSPAGCKLGDLRSPIFWPSGAALDELAAAKAAVAGDAEAIAAIRPDGVLDVLLKPILSPTLSSNSTWRSI